MEKDNVRQAYFESSNSYGLESGNVCEKKTGETCQFQDNLLLL